MNTSAFGVEHGEFSKAEQRKEDHTARNVAVGTAGVGGAGYAATRTYMPEHSHYSKKTRKELKKLPPGIHEIDTKKLQKKPRKLGARTQQRSYVAAMARERPADTYGPVPVTRYKDGIIQRDGAHTVMAHAMQGKKVKIKIEDAPGYRPRRRTGEELIRRGQSRYHQGRLKKHTKISGRHIDRLVSEYKDSSRKKNTAKRPHGVVEEAFKYSDKKYGAKTALKAGKNLTKIVKRDDRRDVAAGATGAAGVGVLASTPVRRSAPKASIKNGKMSARDARKTLNPGYRPGNKKSIQTMARNLGHLENSPTTVIRYKDGRVIPYDGNHRGTARIVRGDKKIPVKVVEGGERPAVSVTRNAYHGIQQAAHKRRLDRGSYRPHTEGPKYTGKHTGEGKVYSAIANGSPGRSSKRINLSAGKAASGPTKLALRTRQGATVGTGVALLGAAHHLKNKKKVDDE